MQTMEQSLADLVLRKIVTKDVALSRSSRRDQLIGLLERGVAFSGRRAAPADGLRVAEA
jgi:hypothetical protein